MPTILKNYQEKKKHNEKLKGTIYMQTRRIDEQSKVIAKQSRVIEKFKKELQDLIEATNATITEKDQTITEKVQTITKKDQTINMLKEQLKIPLTGQEQDKLIRVLFDFEANMVEEYKKELSEIVSREEQFKRESEKHNIKVLNDVKVHEKNMSALCRENNRSIVIKNQNVSDKKELNAQQDRIYSMIKNFEEDMKRQLTYIDWKRKEISRKNESLTKKRKEFTMEKEEHAKTRATHAKEIEALTREKEELTMSEIIIEHNRLVGIREQIASDKEKLYTERYNYQSSIRQMIKNFEEDINRQLTHIHWENEEISRKNEILILRTIIVDREIDDYAKTRVIQAKEIETITMEIEELTMEKDRINIAIEKLTSQCITTEFICPISMAVMRDPVITSDGYTYESSSITTWFNKSNTSPMTGLDIPNTLIPNIVLRKLIGDTRE